MLEITVPISPEGWDESKQEFIEPKVATLQLEHSLVSLSKWESKWKKPFLSKEAKTDEESLDYIKCMTLTDDIDPDIYDHLTQRNIQQINDYVGEPMTATTFSDNNSSKPNREIVTSEVIYYWMAEMNIPSEYQYWHLNRLITLIRIFTVKNAPPKKMSKRDIMSSNAALNAARRQKLKSKG